MIDDDFSEEDLQALLQVNNEYEFLEFSQKKTEHFLTGITSYKKVNENKNLERLLDKCINELERERGYFTTLINQNSYLGSSIDFPDWLFKNIDNDKKDEIPKNLISAYKKYDMITKTLFNIYSCNNVSNEIIEFSSSINIFNRDMINRLENICTVETPRSPDSPPNVSININEKFVKKTKDTDNHDNDCDNNESHDKMSHDNESHDKMSHNNDDKNNVEINNLEKKTEIVKSNTVKSDNVKTKKQDHIDPNINIKTVINDCEELLGNSIALMKRTYKKLHDDDDILTECNNDLAKFHEMGLDVTAATQSLDDKKNNIKDCLIKYSNKLLKQSKVFDTTMALLTQESKRLGPTEKMRNSIKSKKS